MPNTPVNPWKVALGKIEGYKGGAVTTDTGDEDYLAARELFNKEAEQSTPRLLARQIKLGAQHPLAYSDHYNAPQLLREQLTPFLGKSRADRSPMDRAINFGGAYDWGMRSGAPLEESIDAARAYQLQQFKNQQSRQDDAVADYLENVAGLREAAKDAAKGRNRNGDPVFLNELIDYSKQPYAKGGKVGHEEFIPNLMSKVRSGLADYGSEVAQRARTLRDQPIATLNTLGQDVIRQLQTPEGALDVAMNAPMTPLAGLAGIIKNKGGNWLTGSVEGALAGLKKIPADQRAAIMAGGDDVIPTDIRRLAVDNWIDKPLTKYVKNEMATPEDPLRALAERGILHFEPSIGHSLTAETNRDMARRSGDMPMARNVASPMTLERLWENVADAVPRGNTYIEHLPFDFVKDTPDQALRKLGGQFAVDNPNARALGWDSNTTPADLGFNHLIDELSNAINPESGLPRELQFPADRLGKVSVPQAVERVAQINEWRAAQKAIADQAKANNAATVLHKEYPYSAAAPNPKGLKWVELKKSETLPEGWSTYDDPITGQTLPVTPEGRTITGDKADPRYAALQDALKYEGDTMGHCVGGYCEDVASGRSKIYSLRDAKGQPHVTVEVAPWKSSQGESLSEFEKRLRNDPDRSEKAIKAIMSTPHYTDKIVQIKGKNNLKPADEYQPFVQDFVRSGKWSDVGDLQNTGLRRGEDVFNELEKQKLQEAGHSVNEYLSPEEIADLQSKFGQRFAHGGPVTNKIETPDQLRAIIAAIQSRR